MLLWVLIVRLYLHADPHICFNFGSFFSWWFPCHKTCASKDSTRNQQEINKELTACSLREPVILGLVQSTRNSCDTPCATCMWRDVESLAAQLEDPTKRSPAVSASENKHTNSTTSSNFNSSHNVPFYYSGYAQLFTCRARYGVCLFSPEVTNHQFLLLLDSPLTRGPKV